MRYQILGFVALFLYTLAIPSFLFAKAPIAAALYAKLPKAQSMNISPDGSHIIALRAQGDTYHVVLTNLNTKQSSLLMAADPDNFLFDWCQFANNTRVVCQIRKYLVVKAGRTNTFYRDGRTIFTRLMAINIDRSNPLQLVPPSKKVGVGERDQWNAVDQSNVISWLKDEPDHVLIQIARDDRLHPSIYKLNINTNKLKRVRRHHDSIFQWVANNQGKPVIGVGYKRTGELAFFTNQKNRFVRIEIEGFSGITAPTFLAVAADGESGWISGNYQSKTRGIHRISFKDGSHQETIFQPELFEANSLTINPSNQEPMYATYYSEKTQQHWFDKTLEREHKALKAALTGTPSRVSYLGMSDDGNRVLIYSEGNGTTPTWYLYDRKAAALSMISRSYAALGPLTELEPITYQARDNLSIPAYMALPGPKKDGPYPTILLPHGGPYLRDTESFDYWVQFFLSRGYAVLKPNYRGSAGYGDDYLAQGFKQWGMKMQDDLIDGLDWMIKEGYTDTNLVCIVGGSYGGYAALVAAYKTPDRYKCAVSFAGVANLDTLARSWYRYYTGSAAVNRLQSGAARNENSPILHVEKMAIPLLLVHGDVDRLVTIEHSRELAAALKSSNKAYIYIEQTNGNHHLSLESHRIEFFEAMDEFLAKHLSSNRVAANE